MDDMRVIANIMSTIMDKIKEYKVSNIQDLEQEILRCWEISDDLDLLAQEFEDSDDVCNKVLGIKHVYNMRFNKAWDTYEKLVTEHYELKNRKPRDVNFDNDFDEARIDIIGSNGDGFPETNHYE